MRDTFEFRWKCPVCGNMNTGDAVEAEGYTLECEKCNVECEVICEINITVVEVKQI